MAESPGVILTPEASLAGRGIRRWSVRDLAAHAGIAPSTVQSFETTGKAHDGTKSKIIAAFVSHGVEVLPRGAQAVDDPE